MARFICDGHEYRTKRESLINDGIALDVITVTNNYGSIVAHGERSEREQYWHVYAPGQQDHISYWHEWVVADSLLEESVVHAYVAWASGKGTVENH